jgi:hypothetical protein
MDGLDSPASQQHDERTCSDDGVNRERAAAIEILSTKIHIEGNTTHVDRDRAETKTGFGGRRGRRKVLTGGFACSKEKVG